MNQREAVFQATVAVLADAGIEFEKGQDCKPLINESIRASIVAIVSESFTQGKVAFASKPSNDAKLSDPKKLKSYVIGLVNNWHRKDPNLNGSTKYVAKNPGSRAGSGDEQLKALRALKTQFAADAAKSATIQTAIENRMTEIGQAKAKPVAVDFSKVPSDLLASLGIGATESDPEGEELDLTSDN